jgi:hypothetical protein
MMAKIAETVLEIMDGKRTDTSDQSIGFKAGTITVIEDSVFINRTHKHLSEAWRRLQIKLVVRQ